MSQSTRLDVLVGDWTMTIVHPDIPGPISGRSRFEWLWGEAFLVHDTTIEHDAFPESRMVIAPAGERLYECHYFDSRGVIRQWSMTLDAEVWKLWRYGRDFAQRFTGRLGDDGSITASWEISRDGGTIWAHDFDVTFTR